MYQPIVSTYEFFFICGILVSQPLKCHPCTENYINVVVPGCQ